MTGEALELIDVTFRHRISRPKFTNPWFTKPGPGVFGLNLTLEAGQIIGLVGPNGAGKTTLLRMSSWDYSDRRGQNSVARCRTGPERWTDRSTTTGEYWSHARAGSMDRERISQPDYTSILCITRHSRSTGKVA